MHLLVLSAFRQHRVDFQQRPAQLVSMHLLVLSAFRPETDSKVKEDGKQYSLNAPSGAQCFPTRPSVAGVEAGLSGWSQCTFWCSVLSDRGRNGHP